MFTSCEDSSGAQIIIVTTSLTSLTKRQHSPNFFRKTPWEWGTAQDLAWQEVIKTLKQKITHCGLQSQGIIYAYTDYSLQGIVGVTTQIQQHEERIIDICSRTLNKPRKIMPHMKGKHWLFNGTEIDIYS